MGGSTVKSEARTNLSIFIAPDGRCTIQEGPFRQEYEDVFAACDEDPRFQQVYRQVIGGIVAIAKGTLEAVEQRYLTPFSRVLGGKFGETRVNIFTKISAEGEETLAVQVLHTVEGQLADCYVQSTRHLRHYNLQSALNCFAAKERA